MLRPKISGSGLGSHYIFPTVGNNQDLRLKTGVPENSDGLYVESKD